MCIIDKNMINREVNILGRGINLERVQIIAYSKLEVSVVHNGRTQRLKKSDITDIETYYSSLGKGQLLYT